MCLKGFILKYIRSSPFVRKGSQWGAKVSWLLEFRITKNRSIKKKGFKSM